MEKAEARKLQPFFIRAFFLEAFTRLGGSIQPREKGRYEIKHVPATILERDRLIGETRTPVVRTYQRICFDKQFIRHENRPPATLIHPGHPLMAAVIDLILEQHRSKLKQGAVLLDPQALDTEPYMLFMFEHTVRESAGDQKLASRRLQFVSLSQDGKASFAGYGPHLDLEALPEADQYLVQDLLQAPWVTDGLEAKAIAYAADTLVPEHFQEIKQRREKQAKKHHAAVHERLTKEINYLVGRAQALEEQVKAGKQPRVQPDNLKRKAEELTARLEQRTKEVQAMRNVISAPPRIIGGALVIPQGLLDQRKGMTTITTDVAARRRVEALAMRAVIQAEEALGHTVEDVSAAKCGWDLTSRPPSHPNFIPQERHIEVKGRAKGQPTIAVSRNEISYSLNQGDKFILAIVLVDGDQVEGPYYIRNPFEHEPDFSVVSVNYDLQELLQKAVSPAESLAPAERA